MPLSYLTVRTLRPRERDYKVYVRDGLFVLVNPGGSRLWRWRYRFDQKEKVMALGEYPVVTLAKARDRHLAARRIPAAAINPMVERKAETEAKQKEPEA